MDNNRPELDLKHFHEICPDKNGVSTCKLYKLGLTRRTFQVPVIAVFTKYDQFRRNIKFKLEDDKRETDLDAEVKKIFDQHYLASLGGDPPFVRLESEDFVNQLTCIVLIVSSRNAQAWSTLY
jgi:hypothetical protein